MALVAGFPDCIHTARRSSPTQEVAEIVIACAARYVSIARVLATQHSRFKQTVFCLTTELSRTDGRIDRATEFVNVMTKKMVRELVDKKAGICTPCQKVISDALLTDATLLVVMPSMLSKIASFAVVLVSTENDTARIAFSWDATALCHLNVPAIMSVYGAWCEAQTAVLLHNLDMTAPTARKIALRFGAALHAAAMCMRNRNGGGGMFHVTEKLTFLDKMPERMLTHKTEFYVMTCADFGFAQYLCEIEGHNRMLNIVQGCQTYAESAWIETVREPGVCVQMKRDPVVVNVKGCVKKYLAMSAICARVQTFHDIASPRLLRVVVDAVVGDTFGHNLVEARLMIYLLYYIAHVILGGDVANFMVLGSSHLVDDATALYQRLEVGSLIKKAIDAAAMDVMEDLRGAFASFSCTDLFTFVHNGSIERVQFTSLMNELIRQNGDVWRACGLLVVSADGTLPLYQKKLCCSFCNTEATTGSLRSFIPCFNPSCEATTGMSRGAICRECFSLCGHPLCLDCATSNTHRSDMNYFYKFMGNCKETAANAAATTTKNTQTEESLQFTMHREKIEQCLLVAEIKGLEVDLCVKELLLEDSVLKPPKEKNSKKCRSKCKSKGGNKGTRVSVLAEEETSTESVEISSTESDEIVSLRANVQRLKAELETIHREKEASDELHAREMSAAEQKIGDLTEGLMQTEANVAEMVEGMTKGIIVQNALRSKLDERTKQFDAMSVVAKRASAKQASAEQANTTDHSMAIMLAKAEARLEERDIRIASLEVEQERMRSTLTGVVGNSKLLVEYSKAISGELNVMKSENFFDLARAGSKIIQQIEHYFIFFETDAHMKTLADPSGWVPINDILKFDRLLQFHAHTHNIEGLMSESKVVMVKPGHLRLRR